MTISDLSNGIAVQGVTATAAAAAGHLPLPHLFPGWFKHNIQAAARQCSKGCLLKMQRAWRQRMQMICTPATHAQLGMLPHGTAHQAHANKVASSLTGLQAHPLQSQGKCGKTKLLPHRLFASTSKSSSAVLHDNACHAGCTSTTLVVAAANK